MRAIKRNAPCLLFDTRLAQCAVAGAASECTVFISWVQSPLLTQAWPHTPPPGDYQCPISDIPSFYQSPLCLSSPCPHIRQSSPVWLHLPVWPVAALSPRSVICALKFLISPSLLDGPLMIIKYAGPLLFDGAVMGLIVAMLCRADHIAQVWWLWTIKRLSLLHSH